MAGAVKHMERSHRSCKKNYSEFHRFAIKNTNKFEAKKAKKSLGERLAALFKHQDR
ncbi:MAG: hypothetical protein K0R46_1861 [Herbinix sp.]|jgi:hypothetical protein|nr:hypothetical protein [Herbinix sp.]